MLTSLVSDKDPGSKTWGRGNGISHCPGKALDPGRCAVPREILLAGRGGKVAAYVAWKGGQQLGVGWERAMQARSAGEDVSSVGS